MSQFHPVQTGCFLITTNAHNRVPWLIEPGVRQILIDNLCMTRNMFGGRLYAFCILPNHMHIVVNPGEKGISRFMQSFKSHSIVEIHQCRPAESHGFPLHIKKWQKSFHARLLDEFSLAPAIEYVHYNASHHNIVETSDNWPGTSLHYSDLLDATEW